MLPMCCCSEIAFRLPHLDRVCFLKVNLMLQVSNETLICHTMAQMHPNPLLLSYVAHWLHAPMHALFSVEMKEQEAVCANGRKFIWRAHYWWQWSVRSMSVSSLQTDSALCGDDELWERSCTCVSEANSRRQPTVVQWVFSAVTGNWALSCWSPAYTCSHRTAVATQRAAEHIPDHRAGKRTIARRFSNCSQSCGHQASCARYLMVHVITGGDCSVVHAEGNQECNMPVQFTICGLAVHKG